MSCGREAPAPASRAWDLNDAARAATYVTEETAKARKEAKDAAAVTLTAALSALAVPGATTARCLAADAGPRVLLMGARRSGKSSIQKVVFHKMSPHETLFLDSTTKLVKNDIANSSFVRFELRLLR